MIDTPKTIEEARKYRYRLWAGNPNGKPYREGYCAWEIYDNFLGCQCSQKNGYGPGRLYCKQHAKKLEK